MLYRKNLDLVVALAIALANVVWAWLPVRVPFVGLLLALPLLFVLPGYLLCALLFRRPFTNMAYHAMLCLGLSISITIVGGLALNFLPVGLQATSWSLLLGLLVGVLAVLVMLRQRTSPPSRVSRPGIRFSLSQSLLLSLALLLTVLAVLYSVNGVFQQPHPGFTQLWMLPADQDTHGCTVRIGVQNLENTPVTYRVSLLSGGVQTSLWPSLALVPHETWQQQVSVPLGTTAEVPVEVRLYRLDHAGIIYRQVHLTLHSCLPERRTYRMPSCSSYVSRKEEDLCIDVSWS